MPLISKVLRFVLLALFKLWQWTFSAILPPSCRFSPSCSAYAVEAVRIHGPFYGLWLTLKRLARCHPWGGSGYDPVPLCRPRRKPPA
jgi:uncharacterized protein